MRYLLFVLLLSVPGAGYHAGHVLAADGSAEDSSAASVVFLYINANAGEAAGGHTALRLGDTVFHYQFFPDSSFLLVREPWDGFRFLYNELHNRSISSASLSLRPSAAAVIRDHFTELLAAQNQFFDDLQRLVEEEQFLRGMLDGKSKRDVECLGFFAPGSETEAGSDLATELERLVGSGLLEREVVVARQQFENTITQLNLGQSSVTALQENLTLLEALRVLVAGRGLVDDALIPVVADELPLSPEEKIFLGDFADSLLTGIADLIHSSRPDRGNALLLQVARYHAVRRSLAASSLLTLDPFFADVRLVQLTEQEAAGQQIKVLQSDQLSKLLQRRALFFEEKRHPEIAYSLLETRRARAWELLRVGDTQHGVRLLAKVTIPSRPGVVLVPGLCPEPERVEQRLAEVQGLLKEQRSWKEQRYAYNLFRRNCATELTRSLNDSFGSMESGEAALGGWMDPGSGLSFIPFLFYEESLTAFSLDDEVFLPARRIRNLETLYAEENDLLVWLRESNTLSSTLYQSRSKDTPFLFFTDDTLLLRPLLGAVNVLYGAVNGLFGVVASPFDGGSHLKQSLRGVFYSLPELAFGNIRKGSYGVGEIGKENKGPAIFGNMPASL